MLGIILYLGILVKIGLRDLTANAFIHTTVILYQPTQGSKPLLFSKKIDGSVGSFILVLVSTTNIGWRCIIVNGNAPVANANTNDTLNTLSVSGYNAR